MTARGDADGHYPFAGQHGVHGVMVGRTAWHHPWGMRRADSAIYGAADPGTSRQEVCEAYIDYCEAIQDRYGMVKDAPSQRFGHSTGALLKPIMPLFAGVDNGKMFKKRINEDLYASNKTATVRELIEAGMEEIPVYVLDER